MKTSIIKALTFVTLISTLPACAASPAKAVRASATSAQTVNQTQGLTWIGRGRDSGYYLAAPGSAALETLGLQNAPHRDSDSNNGVGIDSIALSFGADGTLEQYPVYISQAAPSAYYTLRLQGLSRGHSTLKLAQDLFADSVVRVETHGDKTLAYIEVPVIDPVADNN